MVFPKSSQLKISKVLSITDKNGKQDTIKIENFSSAKYIIKEREKQTIQAGENIYKSPIQKGLYPK